MAESAEAERDPTTDVTDAAAHSSADELLRTIDRYNDAWNAHDVDTIVGLHAPGMVFHNYTAGESAVGDEVRRHIAGIFERWPDLTFRTRRSHAHDGFVVIEWTATATEQATGRRLEWDGVDLFSFDNGLVARKDVYSGSARPRVLGE